MGAGSMQKHFGFTMIELVITVGIVGIMSLLAAPAVSDFIKQERLLTNANQLNAIYKYARSEAVKRSQTVNLVRDDTSWLVQVEQAGVMVTIKQFDSSHNYIAVGLVDRVVRSTGEVNLQSNILISDSDSDTIDFRLCILRSGQSWLGEAADNCA